MNGVFAACRNFQKLGFQIIIITNQSGIAKGFYDENDFDIVNNWVLAEFKKNRVNILDVFFCPHAPDDNCNCRKPKPGMLLQAQAKHNIAMNKSWMIGDKEADIQAANAAGITNTILVRSGHKINEANSNATHIIDSLKDYSDIF
ncbi:MAG: HAD family hydrolase [Candidatus Thioglobus sp.]|nr:HAD family hydrolase [Candidatus Thioglobus sp.]